MGVAAARAADHFDEERLVSKAKHTVPAGATGVRRYANGSVSYTTKEGVFTSFFPLSALRTPSLAACEAAGTHMLRCTGDGYCKVCFKAHDIEPVRAVPDDGGLHCTSYGL